MTASTFLAATGLLVTNRPIGEHQRAILGLLVERGEWYDGCGWVYGRAFETRRVLDAMIPRGLVAVEEAIRQGHTVSVYTSTSTGRIKASPKDISL